ncbi:hypothetical protein LZ32DRAFT_426305 [Colletotrichum eremochloae]|nr:hypothetical protein LZ32DRAFT_426305 [Colletotrichum eremochloae]
MYPPPPSPELRTRILHHGLSLSGPARCSSSVMGDARQPQLPTRRRRPPPLIVAWCAAHTHTPDTVAIIATQCITARTGAEVHYRGHRPPVALCQVDRCRIPGSLHQASSPCWHVASYSRCRSHEALVD